MHAVEPGGEKPAGQGAHAPKDDAPELLLNVLAGHEVQRGEAGAPANFPGAHWRHVSGAVAANEALAVPSAQGVHAEGDALPLALLKVPAGQGSGTAAGGGQYVPGPQVSQTSAELAPEALLKVPPAQGVGATAPAVGQKLPRGQSMHALAPSVS